MARDEAYHLAEKEIDKARRSGTRQLNLSGGKDLELTILPESLRGLTQLQSLYLLRNQLTTLPEWIGNFTQLQSLDLYDNQLMELPESLGRLTQLQSLDLSNNKLTVLPEWIGNLTQLLILNIEDNYFESLPETLGQLTQLQQLNINNNKLTVLPESVGSLRQLQRLVVSNNSLISLPELLNQIVNLEWLNASGNHLNVLPESIGELIQLRSLDLSRNQLTSLPKIISKFSQLEVLELSHNQLIELPKSLGQLTKLRTLNLSSNRITDLPSSFKELFNRHTTLHFDNNPLNPELGAAYKEGNNAIVRYLKAKEGAQIILNEAKLILIGEGEVGKTCLMDALLGNQWQEHDTTHGIEIKQVKVTDIDSSMEITLNGWDFGGQRVYRPTHQLFFSAPAVYLVVWKPREGPQQGFVREWIKLIKHREPTAKIIVVATHGGPQQRQPDIDRQELWDLFSKDTVVDFFHVESKPDKKKKRRGILELKYAIARVAATLPEVGRSVPKSFADVRAALQATGVPYLPFDEVLAICHTHKMDDEIARIFITISHRLGHLTHYENDPALRDIVILRPDWLATAMSYVLDDEETRKAHGLVDFSRLRHLWNDPARPADTRYPDSLHRIFLRLMERFDLSYRVAGLSKDEESNSVSLIAQLVPDTTPKEEDFNKAWTPEPAPGDIQQTQICRIVDATNGQSANAEGLFYQLIVRLHRYSLGRVHYSESVHWQRGLILDADYNGRALLRHIGNDVHITVRAAYPEYFLGLLTSEVRYLVESFWEGLRCDVMVPCVHPCGKDKPGTNLFEVEKLIAFKRKGLKQFPCTNSGCESLQDIDQLLSNAPAATETVSLDLLMKEFAQVKDNLDEVKATTSETKDNTRRILSQIDKQYADLIQIFTNEAKEGPRLFSLFPLDGTKFNPKNWIRHQFRLVLWCEHSRLPLPVLNNGDMKKGVYDFELDQEWFKKAAPYLKLVTGTLSLVLPVASSALKVANDAATKALQDQISLSKDVIDAIGGEGTFLNRFSKVIDSSDVERGIGTRAENATLRELHALLKSKDPGFGGLVRVMNKRQEFLWVHEKFASEY